MQALRLQNGRCPGGWNVIAFIGKIGYNNNTPLLRSY
jgi:hypothetical protein